MLLLEDKLTAIGLRSVVRDEVLGYHQEPTETGDLAYRATIPGELVEAINDPFLEESSLRAWIGPHQHAVLYPVRNKQCYNLVLLYVGLQTWPSM